MFQSGTRGQVRGLNLRAGGGSFQFLVLRKERKRQRPERVGVNGGAELAEVCRGGEKRKREMLNTERTEGPQRKRRVGRGR
jgi:hypothetical protein